MPHISKKQLDQESSNNLLLQLVKMMNTLGTERKSEVLFIEFFTETEKVMFAKRLAIIFMLYEGISRHYISEILLVSPSTIDRASLNFENGKYNYIVDILKKNNRTLWEIIENLIRENTSKYLGTRRLSWMSVLEEKYQTKVFKH